MTKLRSLALVFATLCIALPTAASAHDHHGGGWHGGHHGGHRGGGHVRAFAPFFPLPIPIPVPVAYAPAPVYTAPCPPPAAYYPSPAYYAPRAYYPPAAYYPAAPAPFIAVRTPHVAVSIGGFFPY